MTERAVLPEYVFSNLLQAEGWPKQIGTFRKKTVVDIRSVDLAHRSLARLGVALGAGRPSIAARLLADMFKGPHTTDEWRDFLDEWSRVIFTGEKQPWESMAPQLAPGFQREPLVAPEVLEEQLIKFNRYRALALGLVWGLLEPEAAREAFAREQARIDADTAEFGRVPGAGPTPSGPDEWTQWAEGIVLDFERARRPLDPPNDALASEPRIAARLAEPHEGISRST